MMLLARDGRDCEHRRLEEADGFCSLGVLTCAWRRLFHSFLDITVNFYFEVREQSTKGRSRKLGTQEAGGSGSWGLRMLGAQD